MKRVKLSKWTATGKEVVTYLDIDDEIETPFEVMYCIVEDVELGTEDKF
jgi:hypothetical protein